MISCFDVLAFCFFMDIFWTLAVVAVFVEIMDSRL